MINCTGLNDNENREMQAVQQTATTDSGENEHNHTSNLKLTGKYDYVAGFDKSQTWVAWVYGLIQMLFGFPICYTGTKMWNLWSYPMGILCGLGIMAYIELICCMSTVSKDDSPQTWFKILFLCLYL